MLNVVGLTGRLIGPAMPRIAEFCARGALARVVPVLPAVTCTAQATYLTGTTPTEHGIVGNGWYDRGLAEVHFWKQSNHLIERPPLYRWLRQAHPNFTCAKLFWWYNMYSGADYSVTPRPIYPADGRKIFDIYTWPPDLRSALKRELGDFPFAAFWGPAAGVDTPQGRAEAASEWIAQAAEWIERRHQPTLSLVYLPHLDYNLQRYGVTTKTSTLNPRIRRDLEAIDAIVGELIGFYRTRGVQVVLLSEYGLTNVTTPIHLNRRFREQAWLTVKEELGREQLDAGASRAFAVADHQVAHIYLNDPSLTNPVQSLVRAEPGVAEVWGPEQKIQFGLNHHRAGDLIAIAQPDAWFAYYYWKEDARAPDFARTVDIHRKPGYDPVELFLDPALKAARLRILWRLAQRRLGFRMLMDVIPLDATLVGGSHGAHPGAAPDHPLLIVEDAACLPHRELPATDVCRVLRRVIGDQRV